MSEEIIGSVGDLGDQQLFEAQTYFDTSVMEAKGIPLHSRLKDTWGASPFSVLDTRQGTWQDRKRLWLGLGIQSEVGRDAGLIGRRYGNPNKANILNAINDGTSVFDPVLVEHMVRWFCPRHGRILDPFCGGSVRGVVSGALGRRYDGIELRPEQVESNRKQGAEIFGTYRFTGEAFPDNPVLPLWHEGDATQPPKVVRERRPYDMLLTCPPYGDLEVYSDDPRDLSTMKYDAFINAHTVAIYEAAGMLKTNAFACWVVSDFRDKAGRMRRFAHDTVNGFELAGMHYYNEAVLINAVGTASQRANRQFSAARKLVRTHQTVLIFCKGDPRKATQPIEEGGDDA